MNALEAANSDLSVDGFELLIPIDPKEIYAISSAVTFGEIRDYESLVTKMSTILGDDKTGELVQVIDESAVVERLSDARLDPEDVEFLGILGQAAQKRHPYLVQKALEDSILDERGGLSAIAVLVVAVAVYIIVLSR